MKLSDFLTFAQQASRSVGQGVTGLVDLSTLATNAALRPFGRSIPVEQVPFSTAWAEGKGLLAPADYSPAGIAGQTVGGLLGPIGAAKAPQIAAGAIKAQRNLNAPGTLRRKGERGIFMGDLSKTWDKSAAAKAEAMEKAGADPRAIWQETGTFRGVDGKWRQEIDDSAAAITDAVFDGIKANQRFEGPMGSALTHQNLYKAYPDTENIRGGFYAWRTPEGTYQATTDTITAGGPGTTSQKSAALHELQHAIQKRQGFSSGASPEAFDGAAEELRMFSQLANDNLAAFQLAKKSGGVHPTSGLSAATLKQNADQAAARADELARIVGAGPHEAYRRVAGEAEARAVQARMRMTPAERRATFPFDSYDVPISSLLTP